MSTTTEKAATGIRALESLRAASADPDRWPSVPPIHVHVLEHLLVHAGRPDKALTPAEIGDATGIDANKVTFALFALNATLADLGFPHLRVCREKIPAYRRRYRYHLRWFDSCPHCLGQGLSH